MQTSVFLLIPKMTCVLFIYMSNIRHKHSCRNNTQKRQIHSEFRILINYVLKVIQIYRKCKIGDFNKDAISRYASESYLGILFLVS